MGFNMRTNITGLKEIDNIRKQLNTKMVARVGVLRGGERVPEGGEKTIAGYGLQNEYGTTNIPRRSFIRDPLEREVAQEIQKFKMKIWDFFIKTKDARKAYELLGVIGENIVKQSFIDKNKGEWPRNAPLTIKLKGVDNPMIWTGLLRQAIWSEVVNG